MIKKRDLPQGWYPDTSDKVRSICDKWSEEYYGSSDGVAAIIPHAGWYYSGHTAFKGIRSLNEHLDLIVVAGGHLNSYSNIHLGMFDEVETPLGHIQIESTLLEMVKNNFETTADEVADNTVEIQLPIIKYLYPEAKVLWVRLPPNEIAIDFGSQLASYSQEAGLSMGFLGSTDLTHYGVNYNFAPMDTIEEGLRWVREVNDKKVISSMLSMDGLSLIDLAASDNSACSIGAAAGAIGFARTMNKSKGKLIEYKTSYDISPASSFVGYAAISF